MAIRWQIARYDLQSHGTVSAAFCPSPFFLLLFFEKPLSISFECPSQLPLPGSFARYNVMYMVRSYACKRALAVHAWRWAPIDRSTRHRSLLQQSLHLNLRQKRSQKQKSFPHRLLSVAQIFHKCSSVDCSSQEVFLRPQKKVLVTANFQAWRTFEKGVAELSKRGRPALQLMYMRRTLPTAVHDSIAVHAPITVPAMFAIVV